MRPGNRYENHPGRTKKGTDKECKKDLSGKETLMEGYITFNQLGLLVLFLMLVAVGVYVIITLRNVNAAVKDIGAILKQHKESLNLAIPNIAMASENVVALTSELRAGLGEASRAIETADQIASYAVVISEAAKTLVSAFASSRR